jgi:hypothetical protein
MQQSGDNIIFRSDIIYNTYVRVLGIPMAQLQYQRSLVLNDWAFCKSSVNGFDIILMLKEDK